MQLAQKTHAPIVAARRRDNSEATMGQILRPRQVRMKGNSLVKYGHKRLQVGAYLLGNRVVFLNIRHHLLCHWPLLCSASECGQSIMAFCVKRSNDDAALTGHVNKHFYIGFEAQATAVTGLLTSRCRAVHLNVSEVLLTQGRGCPYWGGGPLLPHVHCTGR